MPRPARRLPEARAMIVAPQPEAVEHATRRSNQSYAFAGMHGITRWDAVCEGGADPQRDGYAAGV